MSEAQSAESNGGAGENRTPDPLVANEMLSQLSYSPYRLFNLTYFYTVSNPKKLSTLKFSLAKLNTLKLLSSEILTRSVRACRVYEAGQAPYFKILLLG